MISRPSIAIGPELPDFGSWSWIGEWLIDSLKHFFDVRSFSDVGEPQSAECIIYLKFKPTTEQLRSQSVSSRQIFVPVDIYGSAGEIDTDIKSLQCFDLVIAHSPRLVRYFAPITSCIYLDHPLKFVTPEIRTELMEGPLIWIGKRCNLPDALPSLYCLSQLHEIRVLTDVPSGTNAAEVCRLAPNKVQVGEWSPERHIEWMSLAMAAVDVKGVDFRARHKPPAKALDYIASGIPVITNHGSSVDLNLRLRGFSPLYLQDWQSRLTPQYQLEVSQNAVTLRKQLCQKTLSAAINQIIIQIKLDPRE